MPAGNRPSPTQPQVTSPQPGGSGIWGGVAGAAAMTTPYIRILTPEMAMTPESQAIIGTDDSPAATKITAALQSATEIECKEAPLREVVEQLKKQHKIEIQLDYAALKEAGVDESAPITKNLKGISLSSALKLLLDELQLKYVVHNEVLLITSPAKAESDEYMTTRLYPVKDLILVRNQNDEIETDFQPLIDLIGNSVATKTWVDNGGTGSITPYQFQDHCLLVISQTEEVHADIAALLAGLRRFAAGDAKSGNGLRLAKRPKGAPGGSRPSGQGGGMF